MSDEKPKIDLGRLIELTRNCEPFNTLTEDQGEKVHIACCKAMKIETFNPGETIIKYGDHTTEFYVIIEGVVGVRIPSHHGRTIALKDPTEPSRAQVQKKSLNFDIQDSAFGSLFLRKLLNFERIPMEEVMTLTAGQSFGELSILSNKPRAATIISKTKSVLGVLSKENYKKQVGNFNEKSLNEKIDFLQSLAIFQSWSRSSLTKVNFYFRLKKFIWNQVLFKEGSPCDMIYFIKEGEIMVLDI